MIEIRKFQAADQATVPQFVNSIQRGEFGVAVTIEDQPDLMDIAGYFRDGVFWVAVDDGRVVGTIGLKSMVDLAGTPRAVALRKMFVASTHRGPEFKVGQRLLDTFNAYCGELGVQRVLLGTTLGMKAAHRFYERNGFVSIAEKDLPANFPRMPVDNVFYDCMLKTRSQN